MGVLLQLRTPHLPPWALHGWWVTPGAQPQSSSSKLGGAHMPIYTFGSCVAALLQLHTPHLPPGPSTAGMSPQVCTLIFGM